MNTAELKIVSSDQPVIKDRIDEVATNVQNRIKLLNIDSLVATENTVSALKKTRAELSNEFMLFEDQRKAVKKFILEPYSQFEVKYSVIKNLYEDAAKKLKDKIDSVEKDLLANKKKELISYFLELQEQHQLDWLDFEQLRIKIQLSTTTKKYKEQILATISKIVDELQLISGETYQSEILVEYKATLDVARSIQKIRIRKQAEKEEQERIKYARATKRKDQLRTLSFVYSDLIQSYYYVHDQAITIKLSDVENMEEQEWNKSYNELCDFTTPSQPLQAEPQRASVLQAPTVEQESTKSMQEPNDQPEQYTATFRVTGTFDQLTDLTRFLKENHIQYKQLNN